MTMTGFEQLRAKARSLRAMHRGPGILLLPNAWDAASARMVESTGFAAIATTSAGIAFSLGYPDGQHIPREEMLAAVGRIVSRVEVPVTADLEAGYGDRPEDAARVARELVAVGAVGMNFEDATGDAQHPLFDLGLQLERLKAIQEAAEEAPIVLNARTDVYLLGLESPDKRSDAALKRLAAYRDAGADCVFVPGLRDEETIGRMVKDLNCPVNILGGPASPPVAKLQELGVARLSLGSGVMRACLGLMRRIAEELKNQGTYASLDDAIPYADLNRLME